MSKKSSIFYQKYGKRIFDLLLSVITIVFLWPAFLIIGFLIKIDSPGPVIFKQKRVGKDGKVFTMYKFRTMVKNAEELKKRYFHLNEADGPVFKIKNDPRFTKIGHRLAFSSLDELPQLFNVLKKEMSLVGPRPLPVSEAEKIPTQYKKTRESVLPGIVSLWITNGRHKLSFNNWMTSDINYINSQNPVLDIKIIFKTLKIILKNLF